MQHSIISAEDVHWKLTHLNTNKSEGADKIHPKILASFIILGGTYLESFRKTFRNQIVFFIIRLIITQVGVLRIITWTNEGGGLATDGL